MKINDGLGMGYDAGVAPNNHLLVQSYSVNAIDHQAMVGEAYALTTRVINLNNMLETGMLYIQNNDPMKELKIDRIHVSFGTPSGTTVTDVVSTVYVATTSAVTGTLTVSGSTAGLGNLNVSLRQLPNGVFRNATGSGLTIGGTVLTSRILQTKSSYEIPISNVLGPGASYGISVTPPSGNLGMQTAMTIYFYMAESEGF